MQIKDFMTKSPETIRTDADYGQAFDIMETRNLHHLPVVNAENEVVGILTRRDLQLAARHFHEAPAEVSDVMHTPVHTTTADAQLSSAAQIMMENRIGGLPVMDDSKHVIGMLTETDMFRALISVLDR
jgi:acetoin utilization protein AcuB